MANDQDLERIFGAIESKTCLAFLGAGASMAYQVGKKQVPGLPSGSALAKLLAEQCGYSNGTVFDLPRIAEYFVYVKSGDRSKLESILQREIARVNQPRPIHTVLAQLNQLRIILTSNYDELLESELREYRRILTKHVYNPRNSKTAHFEGKFFWQEGEVVLHKMHGSIEEPRTMVITQSDYIRYLANLNDADRGMPEYFRKFMIPQHTLLFLGYSLEDWNFQVIWEGVLANYRNTGVQRDSYALVKNATDFQIKFWAKRNIEIIDYDLTEFAGALAKHFNLEIPQLGIEKRQEAGDSS